MTPGTWSRRRAADLSGRGISAGGPGMIPVLGCLARSPAVFGSGRCAENTSRAERTGWGGDGDRRIRSQQ